MAAGLPFVLNGLVGNDKFAAHGLPKNFLTHLATDYLCCRWLVGLPELTTAHLRVIRAMSDRVRQNIALLYEVNQGRPLEFGIKIHKIQHLTELFIPQYGCTSNFNGEVNEHCHHEQLKCWMEKISYKSTTKAGERFSEINR